MHNNDLCHSYGVPNINECLFVKRENIGMNKQLLAKIITTWLLFIPIAISNGIVRDTVYKPLVGDLTAHQLSTVLAIILFFSLAFSLLQNSLTHLSDRTTILIGLFWVGLTICFEFSFGHFVDGASWGRLFADYNLLAGRVWGIFLLTVALTPLGIKTLVGKLQTL